VALGARVPLPRGWRRRTVIIVTPDEVGLVPAISATSPLLARSRRAWS
jgi:precorrin-6B methylase 1